MEKIEARVLHRPAAVHGYLAEGPRALGPGRLAWITIQCGMASKHGALHVLNAARSENRTWLLPGRPGFVFATNRDSVFLLGMERSVGLYDTHTHRFEELVSGIDAHTTGTIVNDAVLCAAGLVFGCKDTAFRDKKAGLWFLRRKDLKLVALRKDQLCSNGKVVRELPGGKLELFDIDSPARVVARYELDVERATCTAPTIAIDLRDERGVPDGMVLVPGTDEVVIAMFDPEPAASGRALQCSLRTGARVREFVTPGAAQVTCPQWLPGHSGTQLVLTTAAEHLTAERLAQQPNAGCLFVAPVSLAKAPYAPIWTC